MRSTRLVLIALLSQAYTGYANTCTGVKLTALGKKEAGLLACESRVAARNDPSGLAACVSKVESKFTAAFAKAGTCAGDQTRCEDIAHACDSAASAFLSDGFPNKCEAAKRKASGKLAGRELGCYARDFNRLPACLASARTKFGAALAKAGTCADGGTPQDAIEANCVAPAVAIDSGGFVTGACPTTTLTTTTATTSTTQPAVCGNGVIEGYESCDGETFCDPTYCVIDRIACCQYGSGDAACSAAVPAYIEHVYQYEVCVQYGGLFATGAVQTSTTPCSAPPPGAGPTYAGSCGAPPPFPQPITACCRHNVNGGFANGCHDATVADVGVLSQFYEYCAYSFNMPGDPGAVVIGTCAPDGHCVPAH